MRTCAPTIPRASRRAVSDGNGHHIADVRVNLRTCCRYFRRDILHIAAAIACMHKRPTSSWTWPVNSSGHLHVYAEAIRVILAVHTACQIDYDSTTSAAHRTAAEASSTWLVKYKWIFKSMLLQAIRFLLSTQHARSNMAAQPQPHIVPPSPTNPVPSKAAGRGRHASASARYRSCHDHTWVDQNEFVHDNASSGDRCARSAARARGALEHGHDGRSLRDSSR